MMIIAHRGASGDVVENSPSAFLAALRSGAGMVETDLQLTLDGHLVIHHDTSTKRLMHVRRVIAREPLVRLQALCYVNGEGMLTLAELLELIDGSLPVNLELKAPGSARALVEFLAGHPYQGSMLVSSQHLGELDVFRRHRPDIPMGPVINAWSAALARTFSDRPWQFVSINHRGLRPETIHRLQTIGLKVYVYTVNDPQEMHQLAAAGADGIFTDQPSLAVRELSATARGSKPGL